MLEVWGRNNSFNVQKVLWCCEELEIPFQRYDAGGLYGGTNEDDYLARNPTGLVPTIADGDLTLWESNTIVRYLSAKYGAGSLWPEDPAERALADKWMASSSARSSPPSRMLYSAWSARFPNRGTPRE